MQKNSAPPSWINWTIFREVFMRDIARKLLLKIQWNHTKFSHSCGSFQVTEVLERNNEKYRKKKKKLCQKQSMHFKHLNFNFQENYRKSARVKYWWTALVISSRRKCRIYVQQNVAEWSINPFQSSAAFHIETSYSICKANQMTDLDM